MLTRLADPAQWVVSLDEARAHVLALDDEDLYLEGLIAAAHEQVELATRRSLTIARYKMAIGGFPRGSDLLCLPAPPLVSVESIKCRDADGAEQTLPAEAYRTEADLTPGRVIPVDAWPATLHQSAVVIEFTAGYAEPPARAKHAALLLVGHWYANREQVVTGMNATSLPHGFTALCGGLKWGDYS